MRVFSGLMLLATGLFLTAAPALAERKIALVIGNDAYTQVTPLERAAADARSYRDALATQRGFEVVFAENADRQVMVSKVGEFLGRIGQGDVAMVVYSGHGVQLDPNDRNTLYLLPTDVPSVDPGSGGAEFFLDSQAINFARLAEQVSLRGAALRVFVLDACRNNPFPAAGGGRSIGLTRGLGRLGANNGEFVFFAAAPGELALDYLPNDDDSQNSVFTRVFLKHFRPGTYLEDIANDVQAEVLELSRQASYQQRPYYSDGVAGKACLDDECGVQSAAAGGGELEATYWRLCETRDTLSYCKAYLSTFPQGPHAPLAELRIAELEGAIASGGTEAQPRVVTLGTASQTEAQLGAQLGSTPPAPAPEPAPQVAAVEPTAPVPGVQDRAQAEEARLARQREAYLAWTRLETSWDIRAIRAYRDRYPDAEQAPEADRRIGFLRARHAEAQAELNRLGYDAGPVDGAWGRRSAAALSAFQGDQGQARSGEVDQEILYALKTASPRVAAAPAAQRTPQPAAQPAPVTAPKPAPEPEVAALPDPRTSETIEVVVTSEFRRGDVTCPSPRKSRPVRVDLGPASQPAEGDTGWFRFQIALRDAGERAKLEILPVSKAEGQDSVSVPLEKISGGSEYTVYSHMKMPAHPACGTMNFYVRKK